MHLLVTLLLHLDLYRAAGGRMIAAAAGNRCKTNPHPVRPMRKSSVKECMMQQKCVGEPSVPACRVSWTDAYVGPCAQIFTERNESRRDFPLITHTSPPGLISSSLLQASSRSISRQRSMPPPL